MWFVFFLFERIDCYIYRWEVVVLLDDFHFALKQTHDIIVDSLVDLVASVAKGNAVLLVLDVVDELAHTTGHGVQVLELANEWQ
jgi:hypothetical protein